MDGPGAPPLDLKAMPKVDLHRHLEGCVRLSTVIDLAREAGADLPAWTAEELAPHAQVTWPLGSLEEALARFGIYQRSFRSYDACRRIGREAVEDLAADNVRVAELRYSPDFLCSPAGLDWDGALEAIQGGVQEAAGSDVAVGLIAIISRDYGMDSARRTVDWTIRHRDAFVGFDIAGPEVGYPASRYAEILGPVRQAGLGLTVHYGESGSPEYPREAIEALGPDRLGHGVSVAWDPAVTRMAIDHGVALEMCPTSNFLTQAVATVADHPARRLLREGVRVTLNTDNPGLMAIDLTHEYEVARAELRFTDQDVRAAVVHALEASFLPEETKGKVRGRHFAWVGDAPDGMG
jgi:adenosine deaminase